MYMDVILFILELYFEICCFNSWLPGQRDNVLEAMTRHLGFSGQIANGVGEARVVCIVLKRFHGF